MTMTCFEGSPGSGKSYSAIRALADHVTAGGIAACNFRLSEDWAENLAIHYSFRARWDEKYRMELARKYWLRLFYVGNQDTCKKLSEAIKNHDLAGRYCSEKYAKKREGIGLLFIDEAQLYFNSRNWKDNFGFIEFFTQHRKLKWDVIVIAHSLTMIDKQIRDLFEYERKFRNIQKVVFLRPFIKTPLFVSVQTYAGEGPASGRKAGTSKWERLNPRIASLYDSMDVFGTSKLSQKISRQPSGRIFLKNEKSKKKFSLVGQYEPYPQYHKIIKV